MTSAELEHSYRSMQTCWYELVQAETGGVSLQDLERLYDFYLQAVEKYNRCVEACLQASSAHRGQKCKALDISHPVEIRDG
jgi:hypothetical protein